MYSSKLCSFFSKPFSLTIRGKYNHSESLSNITSSKSKKSVENAFKKLVNNRQNFTEKPNGNIIIEHQAKSVNNFFTEEILAYNIPEESVPLEVDEQVEFTTDIHKPLKKNFGPLRISYYISLMKREIEKNNYAEVYDILFERMLKKDRVFPSRTCFHLVIDSQIKAKNSEKAFLAYRKMRELDIEPTQATYSRLFRSCAEELKLLSDAHNLPELCFTYNQNYAKKKCLLNSPPHQRALGLWSRLKEKREPLSIITCNSLLMAFAKAGDIRMCLRAIDEWKRYGTFGKPNPFSVEADKSAKNVVFIPDGFTLSAVLMGVAHADIDQIRPKFKSRFHLALNIWHLITSKMDRNKLEYPILTLLAHILTISDQEDLPYEKHFEINPQQTEKIDLEIKNLLEDASKYNLDQSPSQQNTLTPFKDDNKILTLNVEHNVDSFLDSKVNLLNLDLSDIRYIDFEKCENQSLQPWQRLALCGGLRGFLDMIPWTKEPSEKVKNLFTRIASLLPYFDSEKLDLSTRLDIWECIFFEEMKVRNVKPDLPIFNVLIMRRSKSGIGSDPLLSIMNENSIYGDIITWSCIGNKCRTLKDVKSVLSTYSKAIINRRQGKKLSVSMGNQQLYFSMLNGTLGNSWTASHYLLDKMKCQGISLNSYILYRIEKSIHDFRLKTMHDENPSNLDQKEKNERKKFKEFIKKYKEYLS